MQLTCWKFGGFFICTRSLKTLVSNSNDCCLKNTEWSTFLICLGLINGLAAAACVAAEGASLVYSCVPEKFLLASTRASGKWL